MTAIDWMLTHGDATDHSLAVQWNLLPDGPQGAQARAKLVTTFFFRICRADNEARMMSGQKKEAV